MLRYGIPSYRLPRRQLQWDIDAILGTGGIEVKYGVDMGTDIGIREVLDSGYDALFVSIGAHTEKKLGIDGENLRGVFSAVQLLREMGHDTANERKLPDFKGKRIVIVGGGNVAMDAARTMLRLGASNVRIVYRRRREDMTALEEEIAGATEEGCELLTLLAPEHIEGTEDGGIAALWAQPQIIGPIKDHRPTPVNANKPAVRIPCDYLILAIGQDIEAEPFVKFGIKTRRNIIETQPDGSIAGMPGVFAGGDCATGPATVIRAIESGKVAAANIDNYLGYDHKIDFDLEVPGPKLSNKTPWGRVNIGEREPSDRNHDFDIIEYGMSAEEALQECGRCLRCDKFGYGSFRGGRNTQW